MFKNTREVLMILIPVHVTSREADNVTAGLEGTVHCALTRARRTFLVGGNSDWMFLSYFLGICPDIGPDF
jgi:hypothetical protein